MPSILKRFIRPDATPYELPNADELVVETEEECNPTEEPSKAVELPKVFQAKQNPIDYAKLQADAIMERARQDAQELIEQAKLDMNEELVHLRALAQEEGFRAGYAEGMSHALSEAQEHQKTQAEELSAEVSRFLEKASIAHEEMLQQTQDELRDLTIAIAEKVVRVSLKSSGEVIARMIQGATEKLKRKEWVHIYIADCDSKAFSQVSPSFTASLAFLSDHIKLIPISDDESGTCIIEMPDEIIDASVSTQLNNMRDLLSEPHPKSR